MIDDKRDSSDNILANLQGKFLIVFKELLGLHSYPKILFCEKLEFNRINRNRLKELILQCIVFKGLEQ